MAALSVFLLGNPLDSGAWWTTVPGGCKEVGHVLTTEHAHTKTEAEKVDNNLVLQILEHTKNKINY